MRLPPPPENLERASSWAWRLLACAGVLLVVLVVLWYVRVIVLPMMVALTIAPALSPLVVVIRRRIDRPAAALALVIGLAFVAGLLAIVTISVVAQYDELSRR